MTSDLPRIDQWLWRARLHKTRGEAAKAVKAGLVRLEGRKVKPSYHVKIGDVFTVAKGGLTRTVKALRPIPGRVGAKLVPNYMEDMTPPSEYEKLKLTPWQLALGRERGSGRPTKRDRRQIGKLFDER